MMAAHVPEIPLSNYCVVVSSDSLVKLKTDGSLAVIAYCEFELIEEEACIKTLYRVSCTIWNSYDVDELSSYTIREGHIPRTF